MSKLITLEAATNQIKDGMVLMIGGFIDVGVPNLLIDALVETGKKNLTIIANDTGTPGNGVAKLVENKVASKVIASHIGTNPETGRQLNSGETEVELIPQGTLVERIRAAGAGLGGFLTPTGVGTIAEEGKKKITVQDKEYLLEVPLKADVAIIKAFKADSKGNLRFRRAARNFNPIMATAATFVVAEVEEYLESEWLDPDEVMLPGIFVDAIVKGGE